MHVWGSQNRLFAECFAFVEKSATTLQKNWVSISSKNKKILFFRLELEEKWDINKSIKVWSPVALESSVGLSNTSLAPPARIRAEYFVWKGFWKYSLLLHLERHSISISKKLEIQKIKSVMKLRCYFFYLKSQLMILFSKSLLPRSVKKRPMRTLKLEIEIERRIQWLGASFNVLNLERHSKIWSVIQWFGASFNLNLQFLGYWDWMTLQMQ